MPQDSPSSSSDCRCGCHPKDRTVAYHGEGGKCNCQKTSEERKATWDALQADLESYWASDEFLEAERKRNEALDEAVAWCTANNFTARQTTLACPEQWEGEVAGQPFYFRERHGQWRLEYPYLPTGETYLITRLQDDGTLVDGEAEICRGPIIAQGVESDYGSPLELVQLIYTKITDAIIREQCQHTDARRYCPDCGTLLMI